MAQNASEDIQTLKDKLSVKEKALLEAGRHGQTLLETNSHLEEEIFKLQSEHESKCEEFEQFKHSTEMKLKMHENASERYESGLREEKQALLAQFQKETDSEEKRHSKEISNLKNKILELNNEMDEKNLSIQQLTTKNEHFQDKITDLESNAFYMTGSKNESLSPELSELTAEIQRLQIQLTSQSSEILEFQATVENLQLQNKSLMIMNETLQFDKDAAEKDSVSYYNALEEARQENRELQGEIELARLEGQDPERRGNSLFAEVEDRRLKAEKKFISSQVKVKSLEKKYTQQVNYSIQLKTQLVRMMQCGDGGAHRARVEKLESSLRESRSDVASLVEKVGLLERKVAQKDSSELSNLVNAAGKDNHVVELLEILLKKKESEKLSLEEECSRSRLHLIAESRQVSEAQQETYAANRDRDALRAQVTKLQIEVTRLKLKCGEEVQGKQGIKWVKTEKIPEVPSDTDEVRSDDRLQEKENQAVSPKRKKKDFSSSISAGTTGKSSPCLDPEIETGSRTHTNVPAQAPECPPQCKQQ